MAGMNEKIPTIEVSGRLPILTTEAFTERCKKLAEGKGIPLESVINSILLDGLKINEELSSEQCDVVIVKRGEASLIMKGYKFKQDQQTL